MTVGFSTNVSAFVAGSSNSYQNSWEDFGLTELIRIDNWFPVVVIGTILELS